MNMLYEAVKEKGAMVIVPSSAVETMALAEHWPPRPSARQTVNKFYT